MDRPGPGRPPNARGPFGGGKQRGGLSEAAGGVASDNFSRAEKDVDCVALPGFAGLLQVQTEPPTPASGSPLAPTPVLTQGPDLSLAFVLHATPLIIRFTADPHEPGAQRPKPQGRPPSKS